MSLTDGNVGLQTPFFLFLNLEDTLPLGEDFVFNESYAYKNYNNHSGIAFSGISFPTKHRLNNVALAVPETRCLPQPLFVKQTFSAQGALICGRHLFSFKC